MKGKKESKNIFWKWLARILAIFFVLALISLAGYQAFHYAYKSRIYPGVHIGQLDLGGLTRAEAKDKLNKHVDRISQKGIDFHYHKTQATLQPVVASLEGDLAYRIFSFDPDWDIEKAFQYGRTDKISQNLKQKFKTLFYGHTFPASHTLNQKEIKSFLEKNFSRFETPAQNASLEYTRDYSGIEFTVKEEEYGQVLDYKQAVKNLKSRLSRLNNSPVELAAEVNRPTILKKNCLNIEAKAENIVEKAPLEAAYQENTRTIDQDNLLDWLTLKKDSEDMVTVDLEFSAVKEYLEENVASEVNEEPIAAKFKIKDGRVTEFQESRDGRELDVHATYLNIRRAVRTDNKEQITVVVSEKKSDIRTEDANDLGIKDKLGTGHSNFAGSPPNRIHNIKTGAESLHGLIIEPGEEFSLLEALGDIDKEAGYKPELVIKDNKTVPEYGGGLCQIGTTMFRATYNSGLPVTQRRNHSYRVSYYEPAGTDATIYNPWPDYKFKNDTPAHILIQSRIKGKDLYFDFWGTDDGRKATHTEPTIYNIVKPGPTKYVETTELEPGKKRCTEHAHNGADAYFDYEVKYPDGEVKEKRFHSHYVPWREVCLIGVDPNKNASTTDKTIKDDISE